MANVIWTCGKVMVLLAVSITAWWFLMKFNPIIGNDVFDRMTKVSVNVYVPMLNCMSAVAIGCSSWAFAHSILKGGCGYSSMTQFSLFILMALYSDHDMALMNAPESTRPSIVSSPNSSGK